MNKDLTFQDIQVGEYFIRKGELYLKIHFNGYSNADKAEYNESVYIANSAKVEKIKCYNCVNFNKSTLRCKCYPAYPSIKMPKNCRDYELVTNIKEYCEAFPVTFKVYSDDKEVIIGINEGGHNGVEIDAKQLYNFLKSIYER